MIDVTFNPPPVDWECPNCPATDRTPWTTPNRFHDCPALGGLTAPMIKTGSGARLVVVGREDYVGREDVQTANGRPVMAIRVDRPDGSNDLVAYPPTAHGKAG